jgi:hypothetical protein
MIIDLLIGLIFYLAGYVIGTTAKSSPVGRHRDERRI